MGYGKDGVNIDKKERALSLAGGAALLLYGATRKSVGGILPALLGGALLYRGASGHCYVREMTEAKDENGAQLQTPDAKPQAPGHGGVLVNKVVTISKTPEELYTFWRDFKNLSQIMDHLESVEVLSETRSRWTAKAPAGQSVSWEADIIRDEPNQLIAWRSVKGSSIDNSGSVRFSPSTGERGTQVKIALEYQPPGGTLGILIAKLFGEEPNQQVESDLLRFKQLMETGELTTNGRAEK